MSIEHNASERLRLALAELSTALNRLDEALALPPDTPLLVDGTMQRFEFCFELAWKSLKLALSEWEGLGSASSTPMRCAGWNMRSPGCRCYRTGT